MISLRLWSLIALVQISSIPFLLSLMSWYEEIAHFSTNGYLVWNLVDPKIETDDIRLYASEITVLGIISNLITLKSLKTQITWESKSLIPILKAHELVHETTY